MKSFLVVGLGRFGKHMAKKLAEKKNEVLAVDINEDRVTDCMKYVTDAQIGDCTNPEFISSLGVNNFDVVIVAIGDNFQASLEAVALIKEMGAKYVFARASRDIHKKFLLHNGADEVVYTERETAERFAIKFGTKNIFDYFRLNDNYSIYEVQCPDAWVGKSIIDLNIRQKYNISIMAIKTDDDFDPVPSSNHIFSSVEKLLLLGSEENLAKFIK